MQLHIGEQVKLIAITWAYNMCMELYAVCEQRDKERKNVKYVEW